MIGPTVRLGSDDMWALLDHIDLLEELRSELPVRRVQTAALSLLDAGLLVFHDERTGRCGHFPTEDLHGLCTAGLVAVATRLLHGQNVITASVVGPWRAAQWHLGVIARYVPNVSHFSVFTNDQAPQAAVDLRVLDELDLTGIGLSVAASVADAVLGATLVIALGPSAEQVGYDQLASGSVLVSVDGHLASTMPAMVTRYYNLNDLARALERDYLGPIQLDEVLLVDLLDHDHLNHLKTVVADRLVKSALEVGIGTANS